MDRQEMIARLVSLRRAIERKGEESLGALETTFALALWDVCGALGLTERERDEVMGREAVAYVNQMLNAQVWPVEEPMVAVA
jgi:hypothetical protein